MQAIQIMTTFFAKLSFSELNIANSSHKNANPKYAPVCITLSPIPNWLTGVSARLINER